MSSRNGGRGDDLTRREALVSALGIAAATAGITGCNSPQSAERSASVSASGSFPVSMKFLGGLLLLRRGQTPVELAYPHEGKGSCHAPYHAMKLSLGPGTVLSTTGSLESDPWDMTDIVLSLEVPGSTTKPTENRWRDTPAQPHPQQHADLGDLDWIPTIKGLPNEWEKRAATRIRFPGGEFYAGAPHYGDYGQELWDLKDPSGNVVRQQYLTDQALWLDVALGPLVLRFVSASKGTEIGTATLGPTGASGVVLELAPDGSEGDTAIGTPVEHYCIYDDLLKDVNPAFTPYRTGNKFSVAARAKSHGDAVPGKFCPGGKLIL